MREPREIRSRVWRALTTDQKQERLRSLRRRQQAQVELEMRRLHAR